MQKIVFTGRLTKDVDYQNWTEILNDSIDKNGNMEQVKAVSYFNGYFTFDKLTEEKDNRGIATKASYLYKVVIPYCDRQKRRR